MGTEILIIKGLQRFAWSSSSPCFSQMDLGLLFFSRTRRRAAYHCINRRKTWDCFCQPKHKVFFWLLIKDRLSTRNILRRRNMHLPSYNCVLCDLDTEETLQHLFLHCPFAKRCWEFINLHLPNNAEFPDIAIEIKDNLQSQFFMLAIILLCWAI